MEQGSRCSSKTSKVSQRTMWREVAVEGDEVAILLLLLRLLLLLVLLFSNSCYTHA